MYVHALVYVHMCATKLCLPRGSETNDNPVTMIMRSIQILLQRWFWGEERIFAFQQLQKRVRAPP